MILKKRWAAFREMLQRYPMIVAGVLIYGYYLTTTLHFFNQPSPRYRSPLDFVLQYSSLLWMWIAAYIYLKLHQTKEKYLVDEQHRQIMQNRLERSVVASKVLNDVVTQLQDTINNPLAVIGMMTEDIRKKFTTEGEVLRRLDQIDASMQRIHNAIKDVLAYQSSHLLEAVQTDLAAEMKKDPE
ncbi:MAG: hypothetical protein KGJ59_13410 [Bacteroidota bacterium]|nr:hypothetical protein [Bacteroidota bacterium]